MIGIIDIHSHMLPGVDDGAHSPDDTKELLNESYRQGVRTVIFTPHYETGVYINERERLERRFNQIKEMMGGELPDLKLFLGSEIYYSSDVPELLAQGRLCTLAGSRYVLVEFATNVSYDFLKNSLYRILLEGFIPVLAHAERFGCLYKKISLVDDIVDMGTYIQVNAGSVTKKAPRKVRSFVKKLIDNDLLHIIATDTHDSRYRKPNFSECIAFLQKRYNDEYVRTLLIDNPQKIVNDIYI